MPSRSRLHAGLATGVLAVSWAAILVRLAAAPPLAVAAWRLALASAPAALWALARHRDALRRARGRAGWLAASGLALALHFAAWIASLGLTSVASSVALVATQPVWTAILARVVLGERVGRRAAAGIALAVAGAAAVAWADAAGGSGTLAGDALAVAGGICAAAYLVAGRRVRGDLPLGAYVGVVYPVAAAALLAGAVLSGTPLRGYPPRTWAMIAGLAVVPQLLGHSLLNWALRWLSAPFVAVAILGEPVVASLLAVPILGERPGPRQVAAAVLTLAGVALAAREEAERAAPAARGEGTPP